MSLQQSNITDKELVKITREFTKGLTKGKIDRMCYVISAPLQACLSVFGIECELISGEVRTDTILWGHYWLKLKDGRILDPTAGQLGIGLPKIYLGEKPKEYEEAKDLTTPKN